MARFTRRLTTVRFVDDAGTTLVLSPTEGDFSHGPTNDANAEKVAVYDRDQHDGFVLGQDLVQDWSITLQMKNEELTSAAAARIEDWIHRRNFFSSLQSVDDTVWAWKIEVVYNDGTTSTTRTLPKVIGDSAQSHGSPSNTVSLSGTNHGAITDA